MRRAKEVAKCDLHRGTVSFDIHDGLRGTGSRPSERGLAIVSVVVLSRFLADEKILGRHLSLVGVEAYH